MDLLKVIEDSFSIYAGMTIQDRAIVDARDGLKPSQRQCMYAQYIDKITYKKPFKKSSKSVAAALDHFYVHGDSSCYALLTRLAKNFTMRYPYEDFDGSYGTITSGNSEAASRYTEMRLGELGCKLFENIEKDCINLWYDNYDNTEQFPSVVPSLGYYGICNGAMGIATGLSTSIPQYNIKEVNEAMIKLLWNPDIDFEEIYCAPDFCTGATILNADQIKESHKNGFGKAAIIRSTITYNEKENCLYVTEIPYGVYTGTICGQIKEKIESGELIGIKNLLDLSTKNANIKIVLEKNTNVKQIVQKLYKLTSLQNSYTINLVMLDKGRFPKTFTWKEALNAHLDHEKEVYTKIHQYELKKIAARLNVIDGILIAIANIDEVVSLIRSSKDKKEAKSKLIARFNFNNEQAEAILKITLSKLANLEIQSFEKEKNNLLIEKEHHLNILNNQTELYKEIESGLREIANKYSDERRTKLINLDYKGEEENAEPIEKKELLIYFTNLGNVYTYESSTLMRTKRGGKGSKVKMSANEVVTKVIRDDNFGSLLVFSNLGKMYSLNTDELPLNSKINLSQLFEFSPNEKPTAMITLKKDDCSYLVFVTKNGMIKKTKIEEYKLRRGKSLKAINLKDNDEVLTVIPMNTENLGLLSSSGNFIRINTSEINPIGRATAGIKGIKLNDNETVIDAKPIKDTDKFLITVTSCGLTKKTSLDEFNLSGRATRGKRISDTKDGDTTVKFLTIGSDCDIIYIEKKRSIKISSSELRTLSRSAIGVKAITLAENERIVDLAIEED